MINTGKVASFIDNVIVEIEKEKGYDKVIEGVAKILVKNDLYIKIEEKKMKMVLN